MCLVHRGLQDTIAIKPNAFGIDPEDALEAEVNNKYANRVVFDVGLAICVFDFVKIGEGVVHYGDGCYWHKGGTCVPRALVKFPQ